MNAKTHFQGWTIFPEITGTEIFHLVEEPYISVVHVNHFCLVGGQHSHAAVSKLHQQ